MNIIEALYARIRTRWLAILGLVLGNDLLVIIECLVIGIQTTRLVLFAFFMELSRKSS